MTKEPRRWLSRRRPGRGALAGLLATLWFAAGPVVAQQETAAPKLAESGVWQQWVIGSVFLLGCLVVAFKNSKRSHVQ